MSDLEVKKIAFLISSNDKEQRLGDVKRATLNFLFQFQKNNYPCASKSYHKSIADKVKWSFKFLEKNPRKYSMLQEWKELNHSEVCLYEEELEKRHNCNNDFKENCLVNGASFLSEALKSVVHDYSWESYGLVSPIKKPIKRSGQSSRNLSLASRVQIVEKFSSNIVAIIAPLPKSQGDLDEFFDWRNTNQEYIFRKLMPPHLRAYFREKYGISLIWIDSSKSVDQTFQGTQNDFVGLKTMRSFLKSLGGDVLPITVFSDVSSRFNGLREIGLFPFLYTTRDNSNLKNVKKSVVVHVARTLRLADGSLTGERLFSLRSQETTVCSTSFNQLIAQPCYSCSKKRTKEQKCSHRLEISDDRNTVHVTVNGNVSGSKQGGESESSGNSSPENVLVILGEFQREQLPILLERNSVVELFSVWFNITWSTHYDPSSWNRCLIAEVHKYCTTCGDETAIEELGIKYAIIDIKAKNIASVTYLRLKSSALLNPSCWLPRQNNYSATSPMKSLTSSRNESMPSSNKQRLRCFCSSMLEDWWLINPLSDPVVSPSPKRHQSDRNTSQSKWMADLKQHYETKAQKSKEQVIHSKDSSSISTNKPVLPEGFALLDDSSSLLELKEELLKLVEAVTFTESSQAQINNLICILNSLFSSIKRSHLKSSNPSIVEYTEVLKEVECFHAIADIKQFTEKKEQTKLSLMQVMLSIKFAESFLQENDLPDVIKGVTSHLRLISLTASHSAMANFLKRVLVEKFYDVCGKLLYEVYNELMLPIPELLQGHSRDEEDTTHSDSVLFSVNSYNSSTSNLGSSKSCGIPDMASRRQRFGTSSVSQLRRIIEIPSQANGKGTKCSEKKTERPRLRTDSSLKSKGIIRDLFSAQDEPHSEKAIFESPDCKRRRNIYVSETPKVKQHMTAFTRQSLRMQKQHASDEILQDITIIEESPAKEEGKEVIFNDPKSLKLTRRHSFYCEGNDSRTITRARSLRQYQQGVLATPVVNGTRTRKANSTVSPAIGRRVISRLFHSPIKDGQYENASVNSMVSPPNTRQRSRSNSVQSPTKDITRRNLAESKEEMKGDANHVNLDTSPKIYRKSLVHLFRSPLLSTPGEDQSELATSGMETQDDMNDSYSSEVFPLLNFTDESGKEECKSKMDESDDQKVEGGNAFSQKSASCISDAMKSTEPFCIRRSNRKRKFSKCYNI